jgi:ubiquinone/menaquinone biosynthesis C-methylase UbiE
MGVDVEQLPGYAEENRRYWDAKAGSYVDRGERAWATDVPTWGAWSVADQHAPLLPEDLTGADVVELGCGTAYVSAWAHHRGARRVVGIDLSAQQLSTARRLADEHHVPLTLHLGPAEHVPEPDDAFDVAVSEYGAVLWCEPSAFLAEARRLLHDGGRLSFLTSHPLVALTAPLDGSVPSGTELVRPWFGGHRYDWRSAVDDPGGIEFVPTVAEWFALARDANFRVDDYREIQVPALAPEGLHGAVTTAWAKRWPAEHGFWMTALPVHGDGDRPVFHDR